MNDVGQEYVDARRVLLDALTALQPHLDAFVLIGAQAVYLRTVDRIPGYQPYTTDADLAFDPERLADLPLLADAMANAGFEFSGAPGIWHRTVNHGDEAAKPVNHTRRTSCCSTPSRSSYGSPRGRCHAARTPGDRGPGRSGDRMCCRAAGRIDGRTEGR
jgi:hypothetical protein